MKPEFHVKLERALIRTVMNNKQCSKCGEIKLLTEFYSRKAKNKIFGEYIYYNPECKLCTRERSTNWLTVNAVRKSKHNKTYNVKHNKNVKSKKIKREKKRREDGKYREWQKNNPDKRKIYVINSAHKKHDITQNEWDACRLYFNYRCAYCGMTYEEHKKKYKKDLHKEHVDDSGANDLTNCVPSCCECNSSKREFIFYEWYNNNNFNFTQERYDKIILWLETEHKKFIQN